MSERRHVQDGERARLPALSLPQGWSASPWTIGRSGRNDGHYDDFVANLTRNDGRLRTRVFVTSYDLDGRPDDVLTKWVLTKAREEVANTKRSVPA